MIGEHFYTTWPNERERALATYGYVDEGIACFLLPVQAPQSVPLFRTVHRTSGDHFYTTSEAERDSACHVHGYQDEGIAGYVYLEPRPSTVALYRLYNTTIGDHWYTTSEAERDAAITLIRRLPSQPSGPFIPDLGDSISLPGTHVDEGVAGYVFATEQSSAVPLFRLRQQHAAPPMPARLRGFADMHNHQFANYAFGGRAFVGAAFGPIQDALPHCDYGPNHGLLTPDWLHGPGGVRDLLGTLIGLVGNTGGIGHLVGGYPEFDGWPRWNSLSHQAVYQDWLFRAYEGGLRLLVVLAVNNQWVMDQQIVNRMFHALGLPPTFSAVDLAEGRTSDDMEAVDLQIRAARAMEAYIDSISGGPGQGWYRIVTSPQQARDVISMGKLAVVLGIEVDNLFGCDSSANITPAYVLQKLNYYYSLGVRHIFPIHFANNGFGGAGYQNVLTYDPSRDFPRAFPMTTQDARSEGYEYRDGRRNTLGLTPLGTLLIKALMSKGMIIDIDHMSRAAFDDTLALAEAANYPVVSSHTGFIDISLGDKRHESNLTADQVERIRRVGGMVALILNQGNKKEIGTWVGLGQTTVPHTIGKTAETWAQAYLYACEKMQGGPVSFGTDFNGFISPTGPRFGSEGSPDGVNEQIGPSNRVVYPFTALTTGLLMGRSVVGRRTFDVNEDGLAHVGLLPDFIADLQAIGLSNADLASLLWSAEGYIQLWEKAERNRLPPLENARCAHLRGSIANYRDQITHEQEARSAARLPNGKPNLVVIARIEAKIKQLERELRQVEAERQELGCF